MNRYYKLKNLVVSRKEFLEQLEEYKNMKSEWMNVGEDFTTTSKWGHNHDFGEDIKVVGTMENRHIYVMDHFMGYGKMPKDLTGKKVLVIGCYTGGDALLLAGLGAEVVAIEEVPIYAEIAQWLADSFGAKIEVHNLSIEKEYMKIRFEKESFDMIYNSGVIYHLRNIYLGLENCYYLLKPNCKMYLETMMSPKDGSVMDYHGLSVPGYNFFLPSPLSVVRICGDVGFKAEKVYDYPNHRGYFVCEK